MRILLTTESFTGGVRRHLTELCGGLRRAGHEVILALSCERDTEAREALTPLLAQGIVCHEIPMRRAIAPAADGRAYLAFRRLIRSLRPDLIHAHSSKAGFIARMAADAFHIPVVYTPHAFPFLMEAPAPLRGLYRYLEARAARCTAAVIVLSEQEREAARAIGYPEEKIRLIPNGIPTDHLPALTSPPVPLSRIGIFGRCCRQKGSDRLIPIIRRHLARGGAWRWEIFGSGPLEERLARIGGPVTCHGAYPPTETLRLMRQTDLILLPSRWEGCPYTILEAWAAGVPVVGSAIGGITDLITDGETGLLVDGENPDAWLAALARIADDPALRLHLIENGRTRLLTRHTVERMVNGILEEYGAIVR